MDVNIKIKLEGRFGLMAQLLPYILVLKSFDDKRQGCPLVFRRVVAGVTPTIIPLLKMVCL